MNTPNGQKVQIMLEELKAVYETEWTQTIMLVPTNHPQYWLTLIPLSATSGPTSRRRTGFSAWTPTVMNVDLGRGRTKRELTRAGRIPVLVDHTQSPPFCVMETSAELLYLLKFADKKDMFGFTDELERNEALQWLFFWHGSGAP